MDKITASIDAIAAGLKAILQKAGRLGALFDKSAWTMAAPAAGGLYYIDPVLATTMGQWSLFALALAGAVVVVSRMIFPQIDLGILVKQVVEEKNQAAATVAAAIVVFVALLFIGTVMWAKT